MSPMQHVSKRINFASLILASLPLLVYFFSLFWVGGVGEGVCAGEG